MSAGALFDSLLAGAVFSEGCSLATFPGKLPSNAGLVFKSAAKAEEVTREVIGVATANSNPSRLKYFFFMIKLSSMFGNIICA